MPNKVVTSDLAVEVWSRLDAEKNILDIVEALGLSERTIQRLSAAQSKFEAGRPRGEISRATGLSPDRISEPGSSRASVPVRVGSLPHGCSWTSRAER